MLLRVLINHTRQAAAFKGQRFDTNHGQEEFSLMLTITFKLVYLMENFPKQDL